MACGYLKTVVIFVMLCQEHDQRCGGRAVDENGRNALCGKNLRNPTGGNLRKETAVVTNDDGCIGFAFFARQTTNGIRHALYVGSDKIVTNDTAPSTCTKFDFLSFHFLSPISYWFSLVLL